MKNILLALILFLGITGITHAQQLTLSGIVRDANSNQPLPFVSILINDGPNGTTSDIGGKFQIKSLEPVQQLSFSYVGYEPQKIDLTGSETTLSIRLKPTTNSLKEVVIKAGFNPAHRIIKLATQNRKKNDPAELEGYTYRVYNKMIVTVESRKLNKSDSLRREAMRAERNAKGHKPDSSAMEMKNFLAKSYLFLSESIADHAHIKPDLDKETVLATRIAGLQKPSFAVLATESQAFSVYQDLVHFFGSTYLSPLSKGSTQKYDFQLEDTTYAGSDTIFIISYKPLPNKNFTGIKGQLHITSDGWAVENIIAESNEKNQEGIKLQQHYEKVDGLKWFPVQANTDYKVKDMSMTNKGFIGFNRSYYTHINLQPEIKRREFKAVTIKMNDDAHKQPETFWAQYRPDSLNEKERTSYQKLDSLGQKHHTERSMRIIEAVMTNQLPIGPISLDLNRFLKFNRYENVRLGIGAHTNDKISRYFSLGGYLGYGFRDKGMKYGSDLTLKLYQPYGFKATFTYFEDIAESGGTTLPFNARPLTSDDIRPFLIRNMDKVTHQSAFLSARMLKYLDLRVGLQQEYKRATNGYAYAVSPDNLSSNFHFTEAVVGLRYAFREQLMQMLNQNISLGTKYPLIFLQYRHGLDNLLQGEFAYHKLDARLEKTFKHILLGTTTITLTGGIVKGQVPYSNLYNGNGAFDKSYRIYSTEGFQTMALTEFLSDKYTALYLRHNFAKLLYKSENFSPGIAVVTNIGFGSLQNPELHQNIAFKTMEKGFFESGLMVNDLMRSGFTSLGVGAFYRYGAYSKPEIKDNFAVKITSNFTF